MEGIQHLNVKCLLELSSRQLINDDTVREITTKTHSYLEKVINSVDYVYEDDNLMKCLGMLCTLFEGLMMTDPMSITTNTQMVTDTVVNGDIKNGISGVPAGMDLPMLVAKEVVLPFLSCMSQGKMSNKLLQDCWSSVSCLASRLSLDPRFCEDIANIACDSLKRNSTNSKLSHHDAYEHEESFAVILCLELLTKVLDNTAQTLPWYPGFEKKLFNEVTQAMLLVDDMVVGRMMSLLLPVMIGGKVMNSHVSMLWAAIKTCHEMHGYKSMAESANVLSDRPIFLLCGIADVFFPTSGFTPAVTSLLQNSDFWTVLQTGFFHPSSLTRKRTIYLLKRIIDIIDTENIQLGHTSDGQEQPRFWWTCSRRGELTEMWMNYILLMETLEEKQVQLLFY